MRISLSASVMSSPDRSMVTLWSVPVNRNGEWHRVRRGDRVEGSSDVVVDVCQFAVVDGEAPAVGARALADEYAFDSVGGDLHIGGDAVRAVEVRSLVI
ncbi:hypothetical protein [Streptomyces lunaelactis]|uniref:hypothetical protein n=1 Tax=Streptomyces lunaelactis TaxID=1535768 RepID=UPI00131F407C|nr:hypothetical protein [Streptomyces lunaelactis]NUK83257.1 hypothetical protein [Streptomyces lunaelactis]NUL01733.1 hypothetical protein [Streptomyces lunaelactis]